MPESTEHLEDAVDLRALQRPRKQQYRTDPEAARITLRARGSQTDWQTR